MTEWQSRTSAIREVRMGSVTLAKRTLMNCEGLSKAEEAAMWACEGGLGSSLKMEVGTDAQSVSLRVCGAEGQDSITRSIYYDNADRMEFIDGETFKDTGEDLPHTPCVLLGCGDTWPALRDGSWCIENLSTRFDKEHDLFQVDGGPQRARESMASACVSMHEYHRYCSNNGDGDDAPLYIFDVKSLAQGKFSDGRSVNCEYSIPRCFVHDQMSCITGTTLRPLPPAWLLVGASRSGTPLHDHPYTAAWNTLVSGCKLWAIMPPDTSCDSLLVDVELSAAEFFLRYSGKHCASNATSLKPEGSKEDSGHSSELPPGCVIIVQRPGETVFLPPGWWHVVLNVETSTAISHNLALYRDFQRLWPSMLEDDEKFALGWKEALGRQGEADEKSALGL